MKIQDYYEQHSYATRVKVAGLLTADQAIQLAGAQTMTVAPAVLKDLSQAQDQETKLASQSLYSKDIGNRQKQDALTYLNDEAKWKEAFKRSNSGKGIWKTSQVC